jgi:hypothetical protein
MGIRDRFATGGSTGGFLIIVGILALVFLLLVLIATVARRWRRRKVYNPKALFHEILHAVELTVPQRDLLRRIVRDLRMTHPAVLLISRQLYYENTNAWMAATRNVSERMRERLDDAARAVFGESRE